MEMESGECKYCNNLADEIERFRAENQKLRDALKRLWIACPTGLECRSFHHHKSEQHSYKEECKPAAEYLAAIEQAQEALK